MLTALKPYLMSRADIRDLVPEPENLAGEEAVDDQKRVPGPGWGAVTSGSATLGGAAGAQLSVASGRLPLALDWTMLSIFSDSARAAR